MSRSGYVEVDDCDDDDLRRANLMRGTTNRAIRGKRGQAFLREMAAALDAMPAKELVEGVIVEEGAACALGSVALARGLDVSNLDMYDGDDVGEVFGISRSLACEIAYENDEVGGRETPAERWARMRKWVDENLRKEPAP